MLKKIALLIIVSFTIASMATAQKSLIKIKGKVTDSATTLPLANVTVSAFDFKDTALLNFAFSTKNGNIYMEVNAADSILVSYSYFGYVEKFMTIKAQGPYSWSYYQVNLAPDPKWNTLSKVTLKTSPISMRGDTIEINASRFKVLPGSDVAQLFKQIPGFEVDVSGTVKVNGKDVNKIMVDGSDFFGNNPGLVSKTLRSDMVDKVQVYEEKDKDGQVVQNGEVLINLKLKKGANNGYFGDMLAGAGTDELFEAGLRINSFKEDRKLSIVANGNNNNNSGFDFGFSTWHGWIGTNRMGQNWNDKGWENGTYTISEKGNINNVADYGVSYFNEVKNRVKVSGNVVYSTKLYDNLSYNKTDNFISDTSIRSIENNNESRGVTDALSYKAAFSDNSDSMFSYEFSFQGSRQNGLFREKQENKIFVNDQQTNNNNIIGLSDQLKSQNVLSFETWSRLSRKRNRPSIGVELQVGKEDESTQLNRYSLTQSDSFNIQNQRDNSNQYILGEISSYFPIKKGMSVRLVGEFYRQDNRFLGEGYNAQTVSSTFEQPYSVLVDSLSVNMQNIISSNTFNIDWSYYNDKIYLSAELQYVDANINSRSVFSGQNLTLNNTYNSWLPSLYISLGRKSLTRHSIHLDRNYGIPQGSDLLPAYNIFNVWNRAVGNPNLGQSLTNTAGYWMNTKLNKGIIRTFRTNTYISQSNDYKITATQTDETGAAILTPEIESGYFNFNHSNNTRFRIVKKWLSLTNSFNYSYQDLPSKFNGQKFINTTNTIRNTAGVAIQKSDSLDFSLSYTINSLDSKNSRSEGLNFNQTTQSVSSNIRTILKWGTQINFNLDLDDQRNVPGIGKVVPVFNTYIQQPLDKNEKWNLKFTAYDIFKQNVGISRMVNQGFVSISENNRLQQYFMLTLVYKVKNMGGASAKHVW